jgi:hypothetical protein
MNELDWERFVDFSPQVPDVNIYDIGHSLEALIPHVIEYHSPREYSAGRAQEVFEERVFFCGEVDPMAVASDLLGESIEFEIGDAQHIDPFDGRAPQKGLDAHQQLGEIEGLGQVVVSARLKMHHFVVDRVARCEDKNRKGGMGLAHSPQ